MNYYQQQLIKIKEEIYPKDYLCQQVVRAKLFIDNQFASTINLDDIAKEAFLSKFYFIRLFKRNYGRTPYQYLTTVRINKAKELLQTNKTVEEVCFAVGFESVSSFTTLFKNITGLPPAAFRKREK